MYFTQHTHGVYEYTLFCTQLDKLRVCSIDLLGQLIGTLWYKIHKIWQDLENSICADSRAMQALIETPD